MNKKIETIYTAISKDDEILRLTDFLFDDYIKVISYVLTLDNSTLTLKCLQSYIIAHKSLCESYTYISYIESLHTNNIEDMKFLNRYTKVQQETVLIYQDLEQRLAKQICSNDCTGNKYFISAFKQIVLYQSVIQKYYTELATDHTLIENLIHKKLP